MPDLASDLARLLNGIERPGDFSVGGLCDLLAPHLEIDGVGPIALPLLPVQAEQIVAVAERAPFGRGEQTLVDTNVRRTWQISTDRVSIAGAAWARTLADIVDALPRQKRCRTLPASPLQGSFGSGHPRQRQSRARQHFRMKLYDSSNSQVEVSPICHMG